MPSMLMTFGLLEWSFHSLNSEMAYSSKQDENQRIPDNDVLSVCPRQLA